MEFRANLRILRKERRIHCVPVPHEGFPTKFRTFVPIEGSVPTQFLTEVLFHTRVPTRATLCEDRTFVGTLVR